MKNILTILTLFFFILSGQSVNAYVIKKLGVANGMSNNNVISIAQDKDGFIWIATKNGLNRFDCSTFTTFFESENDTNSIICNVLNCIYAEKDEPVIWIAAEKKGVDAYNYQTHTFKHYENNPNDIHSLITTGITHITNDENGNLWLSTYSSGIEYFDKKTQQFTHYNQSNITNLSSDYNWYVMPDGNNKLYVGHVNEGMSIIDLSTRSAINFSLDPKDPNSLPCNTVTCIYKDSRNNLWVGTKNGLALFNPQTKTFKRILHDNDNPNSISNNFIKDFIEDNDNELWIATEGGGINILNLDDIKPDFNPEDISFTIIGSSNLSSGLSNASVQSMIKDTYGNIWAGGFIGGINFIPKEKSFFHKIEYYPLLENKNSLPERIIPAMCSYGNKIVLANTTGGIVFYDKNEKLLHITDLNNKKINAYSLFMPSDKYLWIGTESGSIYKYNLSRQRLEETIELVKLKGNRIYKIMEDSDHNLWISTDKNLCVYHTKTKQYQLYNINNSPLPDNNIRTVMEDSKGLIWIGTMGGGLMVFDKEMNLKYNYGKYFRFYNIHHIYMDSSQRIWVCSQNGLFLFFNYNSTSVWRIGIKDGLPEKNIASIIEGKNNHEFWISTKDGISLFDLSSKQIKNYTVNDNIIQGDYMNGASTKTIDGTIYFGSQNGVTFFNENSKPIEVHAPLAKITNFSIPGSQNKSFNVFEDIPFNDDMKLDHKLNSFQIKFNVLNFDLTDKMEYMFQMEGLDNNWYYLTKDNQVTFHNLHHGKYVFNVKAKMQNADWPIEQTSFPIAIRPPIWLTTWAKLLYFVLIFITVMFILQFYKKKLKLENTLILDKKKHQQEINLHEEKLKFFTNITHELRTPMTLILGPLEDLILDKKMPAEYAKKINNIHKVANRLLQLINQILEFRKSETQSRKLNVVKDDFVKFFYENSFKYKEVNNNKNIDIRISVPEEELVMFFDREVISIILDNLISNALKYTKEGYIRIELRNITESSIRYAEIIIEDTGYGISENDLPHIFERYFQAKNPDHQIGGSGIGLDLVKKMISLHEAEISVQSQLNQGTTFLIRFLADNTYPDAIHTEEKEITDDKENPDSKNVILVVEDNTEIAEYIQQSLTDDYKVHLANNGQVGLDKALEITPDIIISDIMMPIMDGNEMCRKIKSDMRTCHIPVVLLTAKDSVQDKNEGYEAGADSYLTKPFSTTLLRSRLKNIIDNRKKLSESTVSKLNDKKSIFAQSANDLDKEFMESLNAIIYRNMEDENLNIAQIASEMNMSHSTLYRKIKALTSLTINEYLRKLRMIEAEALLQTNKYNITEVMFKVGISSGGYFRQCFKKEYGMNPSDFLQQLKDQTL